MPPRRKAALKATSQRSLTSFTTTTKSVQPVSAKTAVLGTITDSSNVDISKATVEEITPSTRSKATASISTTRSTRSTAAKSIPTENTPLKTTTTKGAPTKKGTNVEDDIMAKVAPAKSAPAKEATVRKTHAKTPSRKRRLSSPSPHSDSAPLLKHFKPSTASTPPITGPSAPSKTVLETPSKTLASAFSKARLSTPKTAPSTPSRSTRRTVPSTPTPCRTTRAASPTLPSTNKILLKVHSALLLILPLLDKFSTPINVLIPRLSLQTGHRINEELLRKCCYLTQETCFPVELVDYGKGRVCAHFNVDKGAFSMEQAKEEFAEKMREWEEGFKSEENDDKKEGEKKEGEDDEEEEEEEEEEKKKDREIPLCEIRQDVVQKSKLGERRRLEVIKGKLTATTTTIIKKEETVETTTLTTVKAPPKLKYRQSSLLDRIRAKAEEAKSITPKSKVELQREMAASRLSEVRDILTGLLLTGGQAKAVGNMVLVNGKLGASKTPARREKSFSMDEVVERVRESVKLPIGAEEVRVAVGMLDEETREVKKKKKENDGKGRLEVKVVELGNVRGVVLSRG